MRALLLASLLLLLLPQCGGPGTGASEPKSAADGDDVSASGSPENAAAGDDDEADPARADAEEQPRGASCDDGTCSPCGSGMCPSGWYCDENASGGAACSWLTECADKPSCGCITRVLGASCKCREEAGGLKVSCG